MVVIQNELFVADTDNNLVQVFALDGTFNRSLSMPTPGKPLQLATDGAGNLYVSLDAGKAVLKLDRNTGTNLAPPMSENIFCHGLGVDPNTQTVFTTSYIDNLIHWFKLVAGNYVTQTPFGNPVFGPALPTGMVKTGSNLYVANNSGNSIVQFTGDDTSGYTYVGQVTGTSGSTSVTDLYPEN